MKKVRFKKIMALITVMLYMLTLMPANIAVAATSTASAYDVHITGNFVLGQTLTAHYSYYNSEGYEEDKSNTIYTWYYKANNNGNYSVVQLAQKTGDNTYVITSTETDYGKWGNLKDIFVSVSTADANGNGEPVCSGLYGQAIPDSATTTTPSGGSIALHNEFWAIQAHLVPKNYEGTTEVGDTLAVRYTYQRRSGVLEGDTTFTWYRRDTVNGEATVIQAASTNDEYTLTKEDIGKWIECTVTPYDANGAKGTATTAKIHYGNLGYLRNSQVSLTSLYALSGYPTNILLSDGTSIMSKSVTKGSYISGYSWNNPGEIKYDLGEVMPLDGVFFHIVSAGGNANYVMSTYKIEYSEDNETWYTIKEGEAENNIEAEYALTSSVSARYVRFTADKCHLSTIYDFYPISLMGVPTFKLLGDKEMGILIGEDYVDPLYVVKDSFGNEVSADNYEIDIDGEVDTSVADTYEITYTVTYCGLEFSEKRKVTVGTGKSKDGDMAFGKEVSSINAENSEALTDGNPHTLWEATDSEAEAVINLGTIQPISKFAINEEGENVTGFNLYVSTNGQDWSDPVCSGDSLAEEINIDPTEGQYVKFEITSSSANAQIKDFEVYATDDAKVYLASAKFEPTFNTENIKNDFSLPTTGAYGTTISWASGDVDVIRIVDNNAIVTRDEDNHTVTLTATFSLNEAETEERDFNVVVKRIIPEGVYESTATAYDVHITGNYVEEETLTANYTYYDPSGCDENPDAVVYKWYYAKLDNTSALTPIEGATGKTLTVTSDMIAATWVSSNIFVSVQTASVSDEEDVVGKPVYSRFYDRIIQKEIPSGKPAAYGAYIMPKNPQNTTNEGDTLAAYFTYVDADKVSAGNHLYEWYIYDSLSDTEPETVQAESTNGTYVIKSEDFGKYIGCKITPVNVNGTKGDSITTKNHLGNLFYSPDVETTFDAGNAYGGSTYQNLSPYPVHMLLADGGNIDKYSPPRQAGSVLVARYANANGTYPAGIVFDIGEAKHFNGFYLKVKTAEKYPEDMTFSYSLTGEEGSWTAMEPFAASQGETEKLLAAAAEARYFKLDYTTSGTKVQISEFYPVLTADALPILTLNGKEEMAVLVGQSYDEPGYSVTDSKGKPLSLPVEVTGNDFSVSQVGEHTITYKLSYLGIDIIKTRKVTVANGVQSDGDMSFGADVTSQNATGSDNLTDGNPYTLWETTSLPAAAVIDLGEKKPLSEFIINEDGEKVSSYNIYISDDGRSWGNPVYTGTSFDGTISITPAEARYVKLEITAASGSVKIKDMEVHLDDESKLTLAKNKFTPTFATENITDSFSLPTEGEYGAEISWSVKSGEAITVTGSTANVTRGIKNETVVLTASFKIGALQPVTKDITVTVKGNPVISEGVSTASAYDVHIEGNFVKGSVLTAEYKYYDPAGNSENPEAAFITWYQNKIGTSDSTVEIGTGKTLTITEEIRAAGKNNIFVTVQTASTENDEGVVGAPVYSNIYGGVVAANSTISETGAPKAFGAHLVPQNPEGTTRTGDVIKAYFTYQEPNLIAEGAHIYEWRTYASLKDYEVPVTVQKGTSAVYEIKAEDFGKYIECIITPVSSDGAQGTAIKTRNSLGNLAFGTGVKLDFAYKPFDYSVYGHNAYETYGHFDPKLLLTDGSGSESATSYLKSRWANANDSYTPAVVYDLGEAKEFNGFYINIKEFTTEAQDMTFSYSLTGEDGSWTDLTPFATVKGETEVLLESPVQARFIKYNYTTGGSGIQISDFYPLLTEEAIPTLTLNGKETMYVLQGEAWVDPGYAATASTGEILEAVVSGDVVNTSEAGTYEIIYSVTHGIYPTVTVERTVVVDTGIPSDGDMAFRKSVASYNGNNALALTDGSPRTVWEITGLPAHAIIDLGEEMPVSRFVLDEDGENISSYNIYLSSDGESWGEAVYSGNGKDVVIDLSYARFIKLEIVTSAENAKIKAFEVHLTPDSMLYLAKEALELPGANNLYSYVELPKKGLYDSVITWATSDSSIISTEGVVTRSEERKEAVLTATLALPGATTLTKDITVSIAPFSAPFATDVHIKGNMVIGETLTAEFSYYDPENIPAGEAEYQWYRGNNFASGESGKISGATGKTYTLTEEEQSYNIYVSVTAKNKTGEGDKVAFSAIYDTPSTVSIEEAPVVSTPYISTVSPTETMLAGDTVRVHYTYQERGLVKEGKTTYLWVTKETPDSAPKTVQAESTKDTYTLTEDDFGKWIECIITPISESGLRGKSVTAKNHYGNGFLSNDTKSYTGTSWMYSQKGINAGRVYAFDEAGVNSCNRTSSLSEIIYSMDAGREIEFDGIYVKTGGSADKLKLEYSNDGENYTELPLGEKEKSLTGGIGKEFEFENVILARYIRLALTNTAKGYFNMESFYPYLTYKAGPELTVEKAEGEEIRQFQPFTDNAFSAVDAYGHSVNELVVTEGSVDTSVLGAYTLTYTLEMAGYPKVTATKIYNVVAGIPTEGDSAYGKNVTASTPAQALTDGNPYTLWTSSEANEAIIIDMGDKAGISKLYLGEQGANITAASVYCSDDGEKWSTVIENAPLTEGSVSFEPQQAKYVKVSVQAAAPFTLHSIEASLDEAGKVKLAHNNLEISGDLKAVTEDLALPKAGDYGVEITWESENSKVIDSEGAIKRGEKDVTVKLTATIKNDALTLTKEFSVTVKAHPAYAGGSSGGSSGGGSSSGGGFGSFGGGSGGVAAPITPQTPVTPSEPYKVFKDVTDSHWAAEYINALSQENIISGKGNGSYEPEANITRAEYLKLLIETLKLTADESAQHSFSDVAKDSWYEKYVNIAVALGIANGTGEGTFSPDAPILRRDMAVLAHRAVEAAGMELEKLNESTLVDHHTIADYAKASVNVLAGAGIINGNEKGEFMPDSLANRAQSAKIIYMLKEQVKE